MRARAAASHPHPNGCLRHAPSYTATATALGRAVCVSAHSSWHSGARMLRAALPREIKHQLPPAASWLGASVAVLAPAAYSLSLAGRTVGSLPVPQTGAVSEAVPSTVFHQRQDPADNCSVLYPVGDNQGRTNFTQSSPRRNPCGVVWDHCRVSSEVCEVSVWSLCTRCGRVTGEVCRGTIYGIPLEV